MYKVQFNQYINYNEYFLSTITFNVFIYVLLVYNLFSLFFIFDVKFVKSLVELKDMNYVDGVTSCVILTFLSLAGIPPLLGFVSKFLLFIYFLIKVNLAIVLLIILFNFFVMFFYLQNIRFLVSKNPKMYFNIKNNFVFLDKNLILFIICLNLFSIFGVIVTDDYTIFFHCISSYLI